MRNGWTNKILWAVYLSLLGVLLPHTQWAFSRFEPLTGAGNVTAWAAAFAFEAAIAVLTHKLARHIEGVRGRKRLFARRYFNAYTAGLLVAVGVSALANMAHAVEFGGELTIFARWGVPFGVYALAFGAILPLVSLLFARVLSNVVDSDLAEQGPDPVLAKAKQDVRELRAAVRDAERRAELAEQRFGAMGDVFVRLFSTEDKSERILAAAELWPQLPQRWIALIAESSTSYVSEVLARTDAEQEYIERE